MNLIQRTFIKGTGYDYPDLPGLGDNNGKLGLPERLSTGIQFRVPEYNSGSGTYFTEKNRVIIILFVRIAWSYYYPEKTKLLKPKKQRMELFSL